jgi:hypothetical protein
MKEINEIKVGWDNPLYLIVYADAWTGEAGLDYTTNLIEFKELLEHHEKYGNSYQVFKVINGKKEELK